MATLQQLIYERAHQLPKKIALVHQTRAWTYEELVKRAEKIAALLASKGGKAARVGILLPHSLEYAATILGILRVGSACVPLEPSHPPKVLQRIIEQCGIQYMITQAGMDTSALPYGLTYHWIADDKSPLNQEEQHALDRLPSPTPKQLAYILYTTGSTGKPKGVMRSHENLSHSLSGIVKRLQLSAEDVYLQTSPFTFSAAFRQVMTALLAGARCIVVDRSQRNTGYKLLKLMQEYQVTVVDTGIAFWRNILRFLDDQKKHSETITIPKTLRIVITGGECVSLVTYRKLRSYLPNHTKVYNFLGQSETVMIAAFEAPTDYQPVYANQQYLPVGFPLTGNHLYILDEAMQPVPQGQFGELCLAGPGVFLGYLDLPERNQEKLVAHTFPEAMDYPLFKTGDYARQHPNGAIEIVGRIDFQFQAHSGTQIEPEGIEAQLLSFPAVRETVVVPRLNPEGEPAVVAYVVFAQKPTNETWQTLYQFLDERMMKDMVPELFVNVDHLPLNRNGKIDRSALPKPNFHQETIFTTAKGL
ncbi:MAG: amino acid adenylation domain-containing protein [Flammeovirgaceae bacterium]